MVSQLLTAVGDKLLRLLFSVRLNLHLDKVKKRMWLPIPRKLDIAVLEQLLAHNVSKSVVLVLDHESSQVGNLTALGVRDLGRLVLDIVLAVRELLVDQFHYKTYN